jgi:hypothetical protein
MSEGLSITDCRSVYLESGQNYFAKPPREACRLDFTDIPFVETANDRSGKSAIVVALSDPTSTPDDQPTRF